MRDGEPNVYTGIANLRNGYMQQQWGRVQIFFVFNTVALPIVFGTGQPGAVKFVISVVGISLHTLLLNAILRADQWIEFLDTKLASLERLDHDDPNQVRVQIFSDDDFARRRRARFASRRIFGAIGIVTAIVWIEEAARHAFAYFN